MPATDKDWAEEYLSLDVALKVVDGIDDAIAHIDAYGTGHTEAARVIYDPKKVSYAQLVEYFWRHIDPTVKDRQFCDIGTQYRSGIYWQNDAERKVVEASRDALIKSGKFKTIHTELAPATTSTAGIAVATRGWRRSGPASESSGAQRVSLSLATIVGAGGAAA